MKYLNKLIAGKFPISFLGLYIHCPFVLTLFWSNRVEWFMEEGTFFDPKDHGGRVEVAKVYGKARNVLLGERPALNMLARASGIATR